jgi:predicted nucleic acid-binding protein
MIVVDSSVWIANLRDLDLPVVRRLRAIHRTSDIVVGDIVLAEVLQGARSEAHATVLERDLRQFTIAPMLNDQSATRAAAHYRALRRQGITVRKIADLIIGTFCIHHDYPLLHDDRDFDGMATHLGLRLA